MSGSVAVASSTAPSGVVPARASNSSGGSSGAVSTVHASRAPLSSGPASAAAVAAAAAAAAAGTGAALPSSGGAGAAYTDGVGRPAARRPGTVPRKPTNLLYRLSAGLLSTYKVINKRYYAKKKALQTQQQQQQQPQQQSGGQQQASGQQASSGATASSGASQPLMTQQQAAASAAGSGNAAAAASAAAQKPGAQAAATAAAGAGASAGAAAAPGGSAAAGASGDAKDGSVYNDGFDNKEGEYIVTPGDHLGSDKLLQIIKKIGNGQFGQVVKAWDSVRQCAVAVKIIRNRKIFLDQAQHEIRILSLIQAVPHSENVIVRYFSNFSFRNHLCLTFELLSYNLYEVLVITRFQGLTLDAVRNVAEQLLRALAILEDKGVIHCDLKPENVLLVDPEHSYVKLIDFGSSCMVGKTAYVYVQSRFYRAPEVILQLPYGCPIDMWSLGCMLVELHTGDPLFNGSAQVKQIGRFWEVLGPPPSRLIAASKVRDKFFTTRTAEEGAPNAGQLQFTLRPECIRTGDTKLRRRDLWEILGGATGGPEGRFANEPHHTPDDYKLFMDLILQMLKYEPTQRIRPRDALQHPFITQRAAARNKSTPSTPGGDVADLQGKLNALRT